MPEVRTRLVAITGLRSDVVGFYSENQEKKKGFYMLMDTSGIEPETTRKNIMQSERDNQLHHVPVLKGCACHHMVDCDSGENQTSWIVCW